MFSTGLYCYFSDIWPPSYTPSIFNDHISYTITYFRIFYWKIALYLVQKPASVRVSHPEETSTKTVNRLLTKYLQLFTKYQQENLFLEPEERTQLMLELERLQKILVEWIINENIDINTIPSLRLQVLVQEKLGLLTAIEHLNTIQSTNESQAVHNVARLAALDKITNEDNSNTQHQEVKNFQTTMLDFLENVEKKSDSHKNATIQKLRLIVSLKDI